MRDGLGRLWRAGAWDILIFPIFLYFIMCDDLGRLLSGCMSTVTQLASPNARHVAQALWTGKLPKNSGARIFASVLSAG